jgi:PEP-CTERM motif
MTERRGDGVEIHVRGRWLLGGLLSATCMASMAGPVDVGARVVGKPGQWVANFWVKNNLVQGPQDMTILVFGLHLPQGSITSPAPGYDGYSQSWQHYLPGQSGGPVEFNQSWTASAGRIRPGELRGGFIARLTAQSLPAEVPWFVLARSPSGGHYDGNDYFGTAEEPLFAGSLRLAVAAVPEPESWALWGLGLVALASRRRAPARASAHAA